MDPNRENDPSKQRKHTEHCSNKAISLKSSFDLVSNEYLKSQRLNKYNDV